MGWDSPALKPVWSVERASKYLVDELYTKKAASLSERPKADQPEPLKLLQRLPPCVELEKSQPILGLLLISHVPLVCSIVATYLFPAVTEIGDENENSTPI